MESGLPGQTRGHILVDRYEEVEIRLLLLHFPLDAPADRNDRCFQWIRQGIAWVDASGR